MQKSFRFRLYPTAAQERKLLKCLNLCRNLYNAALEERRGYYKTYGKSRSWKQQDKLLPEIKEISPEYQTQVYSQVLQNVLKKLDRSFQNFFRRVKNGETPGFPRFKSRNQFKSFTYPQSGFSLDNKKNRLFLSKIGHIKINLHRELEGKIKTCTIKREADGKWYVSFSCIAKTIKKKSIEELVEGNIIGIDLGSQHFVMTSENQEISPDEKFLKKDLKKLQTLDYKISKKKKQKEKSPALLRSRARLFQHIKNGRKDFHFKTANQLLQQNDILLLEKLTILNMIATETDSNKRRAYLDAAWGQFVNILIFKAEEAGKLVLQVNPKHTSQRCACCGNIKYDLTLKHRIYICDVCHLEIDRDLNAAINIKQLGLRLLYQQAQSERVGTDSQKNNPNSSRSSPF